MAEARVLIAPSIMSADLGDLTNQVQAVTAAGADLIHVDVMDRPFCAQHNHGRGGGGRHPEGDPPSLNIHLMITEPDNLLPTFMKAPTDQILVHAEACTHLHRTVARVKDEGNQIGVAVNPATPLSAVEEVLPLLDIVLVMSVNPGYGGQAYIPASVDKVKRLKGILDDGRHAAQIEVDGGVKADWTAEESVKAGATILVSGTGIFSKDQTVAEAMGNMRCCIAGALNKPAQ